MPNPSLGTRVAAASAAFVLACSSASAQHPAVGEPAPALRPQAAHGSVPPTLTELRGKAVLLDLFATW